MFSIFPGTDHTLSNTYCKADKQSNFGPRDRRNLPTFRGFKKYIFSGTEHTLPSYCDRTARIIFFFVLLLLIDLSRDRSHPTGKQIITHVFLVREYTQPSHSLLFLNHFYGILVFIHNVSEERIKR